MAGGGKWPSMEVIEAIVEMRGSEYLVGGRWGEFGADEGAGALKESVVSGRQLGN